MEPGVYKWENGQFVRVGDPTVMYRYHGTVQPKDILVESFDSDDQFGRLRIAPKGGVAVLYTAHDPADAMGYANLSKTLYGRYLSDDTQAQVYILSLHPHTVADLSDCDDYRALKKAEELGFDVIDYPNFDEQPETRIINRNVITIENAYAVLPIYKLSNNESTKLDEFLVESSQYYDSLDCDSDVNKTVALRHIYVIDHIKELEHDDSLPRYEQRPYQGRRPETIAAEERFKSLQEQYKKELEELERKSLIVSALPEDEQRAKFDLAVGDLVRVIEDVVTEESSYEDRVTYNMYHDAEGVVEKIIPDPNGILFETDYIGVGGKLRKDMPIKIKRPRHKLQLLSKNYRPREVVDN